MKSCTLFAKNVYQIVSNYALHKTLHYYARFLFLFASLMHFVIKRGHANMKKFLVALFRGIVTLFSNINSAIAASSALF